MTKQLETRRKIDHDQKWTMSIPAAGRKYYNLEINGSYEAAKRGDIPYVQVGRLKRALVRAIEQKLSGHD